MSNLRLQTSASPHMHGHCTDHHNLPSPPPQVLSLHHIPNNHVLNSPKKPSIFSHILNSSTSLQLLGNPSWNSINKHGFLNNKHVIDVSSCNEMIRDCTDNALFEDAIRVYVNLLRSGFPVEEFRFFPCLIKAFGGLCDVRNSGQIHGHVLKLGFFDDVYVANALLSAYWKCGAVENAVKMFEKMGERDSVTWNSMISGYCQSGDYTDSLKIFRMMIKDYGLYPNRVACLSAVSACSSVYWLTHGREIHAFVLKHGWDADEFLVSALIDLYMKCEDLRNSNNVFRSILDCESVRGNPVIWNVMILGYVSNGCLTLALELFIEMLGLGIKPDSLTMVDVLVLCSESSDLEVGKQIHGFILRFGLDNDVRVCTALMEMYFKCGDPESGFNIFKRSQNRNLVTWGAVLSNCAQNGYPIKALELFYDFMSEHGGFPDSFMLVSVLRACSSLTSKPRGEEIHGLAVKMSFDSNVYVGGALVDMYGKGRDIESAQKVFGGLLSRDLVSWNALISGYSQNECADEALNSFREMQSEQIRPNTVTASCILSVCAHLSVFSVCKEVHCYLLRQGFLPNILVSNSLIAAYAKCGDMNSSWTIFEQMPEGNEVSWNSIIFGLGMHGCTDKIIVLFGKMKEAGMKPNHATFTALLSACSHAGRVGMGWQFFRSMSEDYKLEPQLEHYTCMVDLLGRAGHLNQAYDLIMAMPLVPDGGIWGSLLGSCRSHSNEKLAELIANHIFELDPTNIGYRVLLANMYEDFGKSNEVARIRGAIKDMGLKKQPGCSWIEINNNVSIFVASDCSHLETDEIYAAINVLTMEMKRAGYIPQSGSVNVGLNEVYGGDLASSEKTLMCR